MRNFYIILIVISIYAFPLLGVESLLVDRVNISLLMPQLGTGSSLTLTPGPPSTALYSIGGTNTSFFDPAYLQEAVLGIALNDGSSENISSIKNEHSLKSDLNDNSVGCGCYQGGFGGIAGTGGSSGGGGSFSLYAGSSNYSLGGMGFGGGGGGGSNTPPTDPPINPPSPPPPVHSPEPGTWLTLGGILSIFILWKGRFRSFKSES